MYYDGKQMNKGVNMKIESSEVQMCTQSSSFFEMNIESKLSFMQFVLNPISVPQPKETSKEIKKEPSQLNFIEQTYEAKYAQSHLQPYQEITKIILEQILQRFLQGKKCVSMYPKISDLENSMNQEAQENLRFAIKKEVKIEKTIEYARNDAIAFNTQAVIKTKDKEFTIDLEYSYTKAFFEQHKETLEFEEINFLDPLVIQYDTNATAFDMLSDTMSFKFDLKNNEMLLDLPMLKKGNGFLVLDKNGNGEIDNGSELFGPSTNNGFEELSQFDSDGNNWIDENDPIFKDLLIWSKNETGEDTLVALGQSGIGALYLNEMKSNFTYNKSVNESMAYLKSSSIFLREDGTAGVLSALDFIA